MHVGIVITYRWRGRHPEYLHQTHIIPNPKLTFTLTATERKTIIIYYDIIISKSKNKFSKKYKI